MRNENLIASTDFIQKRFLEMGLSDPAALVSADLNDFDQDKRARSIVDTCVTDLAATAAARIREEYFGIGPLNQLIENENITEIIINGGDAIWYEQNGKLHPHDDTFLSAITFQNFLQRLARDAKIQTSIDCPFADGQWRDFRVHLAIPPATPRPTIALRRHPKLPWRLEDLATREWASSEAMRSLRELIDQKKNILIVGCTGSGKTSVLNACLQEIKSNERAVIIEDTSELSPPNDVSTKLLTRRDTHGLLKEVDQSELLKQSLRMRPDRIVMGEIRSSEAKDLLMAFATGHSGCMGTLHAETPRQALIRLEMLIQLGASQWGLQAVRTLILLSLHAIVVVQKTPEGKRRLEGIYRIASLEDIGFLIEKTS